MRELDVKQMFPDGETFDWYQVIKSIAVIHSWDILKERLIYLSDLSFDNID